MGNIFKSLGNLNRLNPNTEKDIMGMLEEIYWIPEMKKVILKGTQIHIVGDLRYNGGSKGFLLPGPYQIHTIVGDFVAINEPFTSLLGAPVIVKGSFYAQGKLTTLKHGPKRVRGDFNVSGNELVDLKHNPSFVGSDFVVDYNRLTSLQGCPSKVEGKFSCIGNPLKSLEYAPNYVGGDCRVSQCGLTSLEGFPDFVGEDAHISKNNLETLDGLVGVVNGNLYCAGNPGSLKFKKPLGLKGSVMRKQS